MKLTKIYMVLFAIITSVIGSINERNKEKIMDRIVEKHKSTINFPKYGQEKRHKEVPEMLTNIFPETNLKKTKIDKELLETTEKKIKLLLLENEEKTTPIQPQYTEKQKKIMARYGQKNKNKPFEENKIDEKQKEILKASETKPLTESMSKDINCMELKTAKACKNIDYCDPIYAYPEWYNTRLLTEKRPLKRKPKKKFKECVLKPSDPISNKIKEDYDTGKEPPSEKKIELVSSGNEEIIPVKAQSYTEENKIDKEQRREEVTKMLTNIFQKDEQNLSKTKIDENLVEETEKKIKLLLSENEERIPVKAQSPKQIAIEKEHEHSIYKNLSSRSTSASSLKSEEKKVEVNSNYNDLYDKKEKILKVSEKKPEKKNVEARYMQKNILKASEKKLIDLTYKEDDDDFEVNLNVDNYLEEESEEEQSSDNVVPKINQIVTKKKTKPLQSEKKTGVEVKSKYMQKKISEVPEKKLDRKILKGNSKYSYLYVKENISTAPEKKQAIAPEAVKMVKKVPAEPLIHKNPTNFIKKNMENLRQSKEEKAKPKPALRKI